MISSLKLWSNHKVNGFYCTDNSFSLQNTPLASQNTLIQNEVEMLKSYTLTKDGFSESFLPVEQQYIPKNFFASWILEGRAKQCWPIQPIWAKWLDWPALVSPALQRPRCKKVFRYKLLFYR